MDINQMTLGIVITAAVAVVALAMTFAWWHVNTTTYEAVGDVDASPELEARSDDLWPVKPSDPNAYGDRRAERAMEQGRKLYPSEE